MFNDFLENEFVVRFESLGDDELIFDALGSISVVRLEVGACPPDISGVVIGIVLAADTNLG